MKDIKKMNIVAVFAWILVAVTISGIFLFSSDPAPASNEKSGQVVSVVEPVVSKISESVVKEPVDPDRLEVVIRKCAHVGNYFILSVLCCIAFSVTLNRRRKARIVISAWALSTFVAAADEIYQTFVPGRSGQALDVAIDSIGIVIGLLGFLLVKRHIKIKREACVIGEAKS